VVGGKKQGEFTGICHTHFTMFKKQMRWRYMSLRVRDAFYGDGVNQIDEDIINGSPVSILEGFAMAQFGWTSRHHARRRRSRSCRT
jgi:hypothetical protein